MIGDRTCRAALGVLGVLVLGACSPPLPDAPSAATPSSTAPTAGTGDPTPVDGAAPDDDGTTPRPLVDLATGWDRLEPVAEASADDTSSVRLRGFREEDVAGIVWILWERPGLAPDEVFRVTQTDLDQLRHLTVGPVAGVSQQVLAAGQTELELLVVSPTPWRATAFRGGRAQLPDVAVEDVTGSGPTWLATSGPVTLDVDLDDPAQLLLLQLYDQRGEIVLDVGLTPQDVAEPVEIPAGVTLILFDADGPWTITAAGAR